jgi:hypothetical protein
MLMVLAYERALQALQKWCLYVALGFTTLIGGCATQHLDGPSLVQREGLPVMVIATLHGAHNGNSQYSYEHLYYRIREFGPSRVGVEIRQEDIGREPAYLAQNYPLEMRELAQRYAPIARGIDWLGSDLEGIPIPTNYWREQSEIVRLQSQMDADERIQSGQVDEIDRRRERILEGATPRSLNDGRYDAVTREYYDAFARLVAETRYEPLSAFYAERDRRIGANASQIIEDALIAPSANERVVFVVGADHRGPLVEQLEQRFGDRIEIVSVP